MSYMKIFSFFPLLLAAFCTQGQNLLNQPAPALDFHTILQAGEKPSISQLAGKIVVLEFWATWCTPCVKNIPHLNELAEKYKDKNVVFVSISDEPKQKVEAFLQKRQMKGWAAIDNNGKTFKNYMVKGRPATFVVNTAGKVVFAGMPQQLDEKLLDGILAGTYKVPELKNELKKGVLGSFQGGYDPAITGNFNMDTMTYLHHEVIRKSIYPSQGYATKQGRGKVGISLMAMNITDIVAFVYDVPGSLRVENRSSVNSSDTWDIIFSRNKGYDQEKAIKDIDRMICTSLGIVIKDEEKEMDVLSADIKNTRIVKAADVKYDDPDAKSYTQLREIFGRLESGLGIVVDYSEDTGEDYIDVFELGTKYYRIEGPELKKWLEGKGIKFASARKRVPIKVIMDK